MYFKPDLAKCLNACSTGTASNLKKQILTATHHDKFPKLFLGFDIKFNERIFVRDFNMTSGTSFSRHDGEDIQFSLAAENQPTDDLVYTFMKR